MTFNSHRMQYDFPYATNIDGYGGLVVCGPMQATWLHHFASDLPGHLPPEFTYPGTSPLIYNRPTKVEARRSQNGLELWVCDVETNVVTMQAMARGSVFFTRPN